MTSDIQHPLVLWAQRSSSTNKQKNFIYLTIKVAGLIYSTLNYTITDTEVDLKVNAKEGDKRNEYGFKLEFYAPVVPVMLEKCVTTNSVTFVIFKKDITLKYWALLSKTAVSYVQTDFSRWTWEGDEFEDMDEDGCIATGEDIDGASAEGPKRNPINQLPNDTKGPAIPQVLWSQKCLSTEKTTNIVFVSIMAPDIAESTLKFTITETNMSFYAYARQDYEEREYSLELEFYTDVIPEPLETLLTEQFFTFTVSTKQMGTQYWPRLQKSPEVLHYISTDFNRTVHEGDKNVNSIRWTTDTDATGRTTEQTLSQADRLGLHGTFLLRRYNRLGEVKDIQRARSMLGDAVHCIPDDHTDKSNRLNIFGVARLKCFERFGEMDDIDMSISVFEKASSLTPAGHRELPSRLNNLGNSHYIRFQLTGDLKNIDCAISSHQKAVESTPAGHTDLPMRFSYLGKSYSRRFKHTGYLEDINLAISYHLKTVESTPLNDTNLPDRLSDLGASYSTRFTGLGNVEDIDLAISYYHKTVESTLLGDANLPSRFSHLGHSYLHRFERSANLKDVDLAISYHQKTVDSSSSHSVDFPGWLSNLGNSYLRRFSLCEELEDIDLAISHHQKAVECTPTNDVHLPGRFNNLGSSYSCRLKRSNELKDIDLAIYYHQKAVDLTFLSNANLPAWFSNLGSSYSGRFDRTGDLNDIDLAISYHQKAVDYTPSNNPELLNWLINLGSSYMSRFERTRDVSDIDWAICYNRKAVEATPSDHAIFPIVLNNLASPYSYRFECTGDLENIDTAISYTRKAVESTPVGQSHFSIFLTNLGSIYLQRFKHTHSTTDAQNALESFRHGAEVNGSPSFRLRCAWNAAKLSSVHAKLNCMEDFALAITLLSEIAGLEQTVNRRHSNIHTASDIVGIAVAVALTQNKPDTALEWLEQGRCLVWNQLTQLRTPVDDLRLQDESLADRFISIARELESYGTRSSLPVASSEVSLKAEILLQQETLGHTSKASEYKALLDKIRSLPNFHDFLQPSKANTFLSSLPPTGPIVIFNFGNDRLDALALRAGYKEPLHIPLVNFSLDHAEKLKKLLHVDILHTREIDDEERASRRRYHGAQIDMSFILRELWCKVVQPVLKALGYLDVAIVSDRQRIWWCPTGPLAFLPLHAAGIYDDTRAPGSCVSDFVVSSYTPTVRSINEKFATSSHSPERSPKLLIISQPNTPGLPAIPSTIEETRMLADLMKEDDIDVSLLDGCEATTEAVKAEMMYCNWAHFACHGIQDAKEPLESGLCLQDGRLTLLEMMKKKILNPDLVFLSACQTSKGDSDLSEEVVHLAAGMLAAGYRGVVGTMWSISDTYGPEFSREFYQYLIREKGPNGISSDKAAYALDYATRRVREKLGKGDAAFKTWVPYVHYGY